MVTLTATDNYGESTDLDVTIMVTDGNEAPEISGDDTIEYAENGIGDVATFTAVDPEGSAIVAWSLLSEVDAAVFDIDAGVLTFMKTPDYEMRANVNKDNIYMVTVQATDATKRIGSKMVEVEVTNIEEAGSMSLSAVQPQSATRFYVIDEDGTRISDPDGITSSITWQWSKSMSKTGSFSAIDKAKTGAYTPEDGDGGYYLRVTASYTDREGPGKSVMATSDNPVQRAPGNNAAPKFDDDQDPNTGGRPGGRPQVNPREHP